MRQRRGEKALLFDKDLTRCLGEFDREEWEVSISAYGGSVAEAAADRGLVGIPRNAKVLWGTSPEEALGIYRRWQSKRQR